MEITAESPRTRWLGLVTTWVLIAGLLGWDAVATRDYVDRLSRLGLRGAVAATTPMQRICPTAFADAQMWVRHSLDLADGSGPQLRHSDADNAPYGREVHWNSGLAWAIAGAGWLDHVITGDPLPRATEQVLAWFNLPILLGIVVLFSSWVSRRAGLGAGVLLALMMIGHPDFYIGFAPNYVDHHGLLAAAVLGLVLGVVFMGLGFGRLRGGMLPSSSLGAQSAAMFSAGCGAVGMWISAATMLPAIASVVFVAGAVILGLGRNATKDSAVFSPVLWRRWGATGAVLSLFFYLLEYAPFHLGFRLEVNHPLYALAWWGGAELLAQIGQWRCRSGYADEGVLVGRHEHKVPKFERRTRRARWIGALVAIAAAPLLIAFAGERVFVVFDPFIARLSAHVSEGLSAAETIRLFGWSTLIAKVPWLLVTILCSVILVRRCRPSDQVLAVFCIGLCAAFVAMALLQARWWPSASAAMLMLILSGLAAALQHRSPRVQWMYAGLTAALVCAPAIVGRTYERIAADRAQAIAPADAVQPLYRDLAARLRVAQPAGDIVLLASPNASAAISYYGGFKSVGTLYWENLAGTKAAAQMLSATDETEARRLLRERGVTHVVLLSDTNFLAEYFELSHPGAAADAWRQSFGYGLLAHRLAPFWLERIPYSPPPDLPLGNIRVAVFATRFSAPPAEALFTAAEQAIATGRMEAAERHLDQALALAPRSAEFWLVKTRLLLARHDLDGAIHAVDQASEVATTAQRFPLCTAEAVRFYQAGAPAAAAELYRRALAVQFDLTTANNLVWILSTSPDDSARNGAEALQVAELIARDHVDYLTLSGYAAALAESGRFDAAVPVAGRALAVAQSSGNLALAAKAAACLAAYRSGRPWREGPGGRAGSGL